MATAVADLYNIIDNKYIYNHDIMNCTADGVVGNHLYSGRALGVTESWDMIQLHESLQPYWEDICAHYDRIGLSYTRHVIWHLNTKELGSHINYQPSVFFYGPKENQYWGDYDWLNSVNYINSKNNFMTLADKLGIDVPATICLDCASENIQEHLADVAYPCYLKAAISVSGVGIYRCKNEAELIRNLKKFPPQTPVQIQEEIVAESFLNLQYRVIGNKLMRLEVSEQILDGYVHQGNRVPARHAPWDSVEPMANWLLDHGMRGVFAFDVAVLNNASGIRYPAIECNPRYNGATYPTLIAKKLGINAWSSISLNTKYRTLDEFDIRDVEFDETTGEGAVIVNWGTVSVGKLMILLAGSAEYQEALAVELQSRLC